jgi:excisionase family DNA binding protein
MDLQTQIKSQAQVLFSYDPALFWEQIRLIVREELHSIDAGRDQKVPALASEFTYKPMYRVKEVCSLFQITKPTLYDWIKKGKLKPIHVSSRPYFLLKDIQELLQRK